MRKRGVELRLGSRGPRGARARDPMTYRILFALAALLASGCCAPECELDRLPYKGEILVAKDDSHSEKLFELVQYCAKYDCCDTLYSKLSAKTRDEHSETMFCLFWDTIEIPEPYDYLLVDVMKYGEYSGTVPGPKEGEQFVYVSYPPDGKKGKNLLAQILVIVEKDERGRDVPTIALEEQLRRMEAGDDRYHVVNAGF